MRIRVHASRWGMCAALFLPLLAISCGSLSKQGNGHQAQQTQQGQSASANPAPPPQVSHTITISKGTTLSVVLDQSLASNQNHSGDGFQGSLAQAIEVDGKVVLPRGTHVLGRVITARASGRLETPALLAVTLSSVEVDGKSQLVTTNSITRQGPSHKKRNEIAIGGGAGAGAIIGAIAGGGKGAAIGAGVGAGAGVAGAAATGKHEITITAETILTFRLTQPFTIEVKD